MVLAGERPVCLGYVRGAESRVLRDTQDLVRVEAAGLLRCIFLNQDEDLVEPPDKERQEDASYSQTLS